MPVSHEKRRRIEASSGESQLKIEDMTTIKLEKRHAKQFARQKIDLTTPRTNQIASKKIKQKEQDDSEKQGTLQKFLKPKQAEWERMQYQTDS